MRRRALVAFLLVLTFVRLLLIGRHELSPDEAYYVLWSQRLDLAYYSKGPGIALAIRAATDLFGTSETAVRVLAPLLALASSLLLFALVRRLLGETTAIVTVVVLQCVPLFNVGALLMTIDGLFITAWLGTLLLSWIAMHRPQSWPWWLAVGVVAGAGILCKYTNVLVLLGVGLAVALSPERRRHVRGFVVACAVALAATTPAVLWNARHQWVTVTHLAERGALDRGAWLRPKETFEFVTVHFGTWSPLVFLGVLLALPAAWRRAREGDEASRFLLATSAPVLVMYAALALHEAGEANWTAVGVLGLLPLAVEHWRARAASSRGVRTWAAAALAVGALLSACIVDTDLVRAAGIALPAKSDPSTRLRGWGATANEVAKLRRRVRVETGEEPLLVANHYGLASELAHYLPRAPIAAPGMPAVFVVPTPVPRNQYWFWPTFTEASSGLAGRSVLFVTDRASPPPESLEALFEGGCKPLEELPITRDGDVVRTIRPWLCAGGAPALR